MKKLFCIVCMACVFLLVGCSLTTTSALDSTTTSALDSTDTSTIDPAAEKALFETNFALSAAKLEELTEGYVYIPRERPRALTASYPEEFRYDKAEFLSIYETQAGNDTSAYINEVLYTYKLMFDLMTECVDFREIELDEAFHVDYVPEGEMSINIGESFDITLSNLPGNYVRMYFSLFEGTVSDTFKVGFDDEDNFVLKDLLATDEGNGTVYHYIEFVENHRLVSVLDQGPLSYIYSNVSADSLEEFMVSYTSNEGYTYRFMNPLTQIRSTIRILDGVPFYEFHEFFGPHGIVFTYSDPLIGDEMVDLWFDMLSTDGWDYAYLPAIDFSREGNAIVKDDVAIFEQNETTEIYAQLNPVNAFLTVKLTMAQADITESILNLSEYDLTFGDPRVTLEALEGLGEQTMLDAQSMAVFGELDFLTEQNPDFLGEIDDDLKDYLLP